ncbi:hypothetical protein VOLCADRAFT_121587 [Volvox carteri f. nagariensis]|uniref:Uncharacterized protein n=1 Tax=Volvox carteri f. nagariensis TaxID=3068 RepID=D8UEA3_VOLCA|nr:uncharacterized protein VOLCADRAFT_121587 [Volvox carteri f. nagariensis]EFJ41968.1 hypothetical protein VOLCADRAFT_121587 [Volvox carteri f. nagariensis]|eukprot:XP_002957005.1 hypothetical protein VOLCADRAFT_121587 [Volvox carteri f. nagariensis]
MRCFITAGFLWILLHRLVLSIDTTQVGARTLKRNDERESEHNHDLPPLDQRFLSVLHLLVQTHRHGDGLQDADADAIKLRDVLKALDNFVLSLLTARSYLGLAHVPELEDPLTAPLLTALKKRVPAKQQDAAKLLRSILLWLVHLRSYNGTDRSGSISASGLGLGSGSGLDPKSSASASTAMWRDVARTLLMLFRLHRGGMRSRPGLEFLHVSKAAGTSMCRLAEVSGCRAQDFSMGRTCIMRDFDDQPRWINGTHHWTLIAPAAEPWGSHPYAFLLYGVPRHPKRKRTCSARLAALEKYRLNFFANEYTIYNDRTMYEEPVLNEATGDALSADASTDDDVPPSPPSPRAPPSPPSPPAPPQDPAERFMSHLKFIAQTYGTMYKWPGIAKAFAPGRNSAEWWRAFVPALFDNYMLRSLGGEAVFAMSYESLEKGAASYMMLAKAVLAQYDSILVLEVDEGAHRRAVHFGLAWRHQLTEFQLRNSSSLLKKLQDMQVGAQLGALLPDEALMEHLVEDAVRYDNELYSYGALLAGLDDVVWGMAEAALGEPMPGFWTSEDGYRCGYIRTPERPPAAPREPPVPAPPPIG